MTEDTRALDLQTLLIAKTNLILNLELTITRLERELAAALKAAEEVAEKPAKKAK